MAVKTATTPTLLPELPMLIGEGKAATAASKAKVTPPLECPWKVYPKVGMGDNVVDTEIFQLGRYALDKETLKDARLQLGRYLRTQKSTFMGYQCNQNLHYSQHFGQYLDMVVNNLGDPFVNGNFTVNSKWIERAVLDYYAALWNARWPHNSNDGDSYWGYITSMGSSEANFYGLWNARDYLSGKMLLPHPNTKRLMHYQAQWENPTAYTPIVFYSQDTHYSITKAVRVLNISTFYEVGQKDYPKDCPLGGWTGKGWPEEVPSDHEGKINLKALKSLVEFFAKRGYPILVIFNYGSTFKGACDDVEAAGNLLLPIFRLHGLETRKVGEEIRSGYWFHVDGALAASYMPFIEMAYQAKLIHQRGPTFDFRLPFVHSISMSGHKWPGVPVPCAIYMTKTKLQLKPPDVEYIGSPDTTFAGSRDGLAPMLLWDHLARSSYHGQVKKALDSERLAGYAECCLRQLQDKIKKDLYVQRTSLSPSVLFRKPKDSIVFKYSLSSEKILENGKIKHYSHVYIMDNVTLDLVGRLIEDLSEPNAFPEEEPKVNNIRIGGNFAMPMLVKGNQLALVPCQGRGFR